MAWNEPGGDKDPWGSNNNGGGPPDLDEIINKLKERFSFGGGSGNEGPHWPVIILALVVLVIGYSFLKGDPNWMFGIYQVDEKERAVVLRLGKYQTTVGPGLHWNMPIIDAITIVQVTQERQYPTRGQMLTQDENIVELPMTVQYNIKDAKDFVLNVKDPEISLQQATDSAVRHVVGSSKLDDVVSTGRQQISEEVQRLLQTYLDNYGSGIKVININIQEAKPPSEVKSAYDDVIKAREDQERVINEAQGYANGVIPEARGRAQRIIEEAMGYKEQVVAQAEGDAQRFSALLTEYEKAPKVTRERMYIDAVEEVMKNSSKVLVDVEGGNNMLYLPLDQMVKKGPVVTGTSINSKQLEDIADIVIQKLRDSSTPRRKEVR